MKTRATSRRAETTSTATNTEGKEVRDEIVDWLRNAYAMERGLESALKKQAENEDLSQPIRNRAASHLEETRRHADEVQAALQSLGTDTSALKTGAGVVMQATKGIGTIFASDERIKDLLDAYSMEHFEIACYTALSAAAERAGLPQVVEMCRRIIPDEERMAQTLKHSLPDEVVSYLYEAQAAAA
jgi:ferritin-like metal-binding protein YciE